MEGCERIVQCVLDGDVSGTEGAVRAALEEGCGAECVLKDGLLKGMEEVGVLFKEGELFVPEVLVSAKAMKAGMEILKPHLSSGVSARGRVLTATVEGDLHDIGVKLVGMMLEGAGFEVENMGVDCKAEAIVARVRESRPDILGLSAMLTTTMGSMKGVVEALRASGVDVRVMVGGAPLSREFAARIGAHYSSDAAEAVTVAKSLISGCA